MPQTLPLMNNWLKYGSRLKSNDNLRLICYDFVALLTLDFRSVSKTNNSKEALKKVFCNYNCKGEKC